MRRTTTTALAVAGAALAAPAAFAAPAALDPPSPAQAALRAPLAGHLTVAAQMRHERAANLRERLTPRAVRAARRLAALRDEEFAADEERAALRARTPAELRERTERLNRAARRERDEQAEAEQAAAAPPQLEAIAACESGGVPTTDTGNGFYGKYQFTLETWAAVGGSGNPAAAPEAEQDMRAAMLYERAGATPWPVCGR
jgi:Transglycosylase-like domain